jgi:hypothetical protein
MTHHASEVTAIDNIQLEMQKPAARPIKPERGAVIIKLIERSTLSEVIDKRVSLCYSPQRARDRRKKISII